MRSKAGSSLIADNATEFAFYYDGSMHNLGAIGGRVQTGGVTALAASGATAPAA